MKHRIDLPIDPKQHKRCVEVIEPLPGALMAKSKLAPHAWPSFAAIVPGCYLLRLRADCRNAMGGVDTTMRVCAEPQGFGDATDFRR